MKNSKELLKKAGILPKLRLGNKKAGGGVIPTGPHRVKVLEDRIMKKPDPSTGKEIEIVRYIVEENGEKKYYDTKLRDKNGGLAYLVQRFAEVEEGDELILEMKKQGIKNYIEVIPVGHSNGTEIESDDDEEVNTEEIDETEKEAREDEENL